MRKIGVALLALMWAVAMVHADTTSSRFDEKAVAAAWYQAHMECRLPIEGQTNQQADQQCDQRDKLTRTLQAHDFCFDVQEQEWAKCKPN
ncbi:MAG: hypothetical protein E5V63_30145 [Mesorhizobium sp.]|nr:MAG: hypothetical protein E5V63_30145 [Mesorhizobium sp.]